MMVDSDLSVAHVTIDISNDNRPGMSSPEVSPSVSQTRPGLIPTEEQEETVDESLKEEFTCAICLEILVQARGLECGHKFCTCCISKWMEGGNRRCPTCQHQISRRPIKEWGINNYLTKIQPKMSKELQHQRAELILEREREDKILLPHAHSREPINAPLPANVEVYTNDPLREFNSMMDRIQNRVLLAPTSDRVVGNVVPIPTRAGRTSVPAPRYTPRASALTPAGINVSTTQGTRPFSGPSAATMSMSTIMYTFLKNFRSLLGTIFRCILFFLIMCFILYMVCQIFSLSQSTNGQQTKPILTSTTTWHFSFGSGSDD